MSHTIVCQADTAVWVSAAVFQYEWMNVDTAFFFSLSYTRRTIPMVLLRQ